MEVLAGEDDMIAEVVGPGYFFWTKQIVSFTHPSIYSLQ